MDKKTILEQYNKIGNKSLRDGLYLIEHAIKLRDFEVIKQIINPEIIPKISFTLSELYRLADYDMIDYICQCFKTPHIIFDNIDLHFINDIDTKRISFLKKYKNYINWKRILNNVKLINKYISFCEYHDNDELLDFLLSVYTNDCGILAFLIVIRSYDSAVPNIKFLEKLLNKNKNLINEFYNDIPVLYYSLFTNISIVKLFYNFKADINISCWGYTCISYYIKYSNNIDNDIISFLLNNNFDVNITDYQLNTLAHIVFRYQNQDIFSKENMRKILELTSNINAQNYLGSTVLLYILIFKNWKDYKDILSTKEFDIGITNKSGDNIRSMIKYKYIIDNDDFSNFLKTIKIKDTKYDVNDIKIPDHEYALVGPFNTRNYSIMVMIYVMLEKYEEIGIPYLPNYVVPKLNFKNEDFNNFMNDFATNSIITKIPFSTLYFCDQDNYYIPDELNDAVKYSIKRNKKFLIIDLTLYHPVSRTSLHSNLLLIDVKKNAIIHFEPHGSKPDAGFNNETYLFIKRRIIQVLPTFTFYEPKDYLPAIGFQLMSNELDYMDKKFGDPNGYCTGWCFWFIELYLNNTNNNIKQLVNKAIKRLIKHKYTFKEHIRNYTSYLTAQTNTIFRDCGMPERFINSYDLRDSYINIIVNCLQEKYEDILT